MNISVTQTPEQLARSLLPGLKALTVQSLRNILAAELQKHAAEWIERSFKDGHIRGVSYDVATGKSVIVFELDTRELL